MGCTTVNRTENDKRNDQTYALLATSKKRGHTKIADNPSVRRETNVNATANVPSSSHLRLSLL